jgi:hypothetical protein
MARYLRIFTSERLLRYSLVIPVFLTATFQSAQVFYATYDVLITHYGNPIRLAYHDWVRTEAVARDKKDTFDKA